MKKNSIKNKTWGWLLLMNLLVSVEVMSQFSLSKVWESDSTLKVPESVLLDREAGILYVSNIDGLDPWGADHKGSISKLGLDGKVLSLDWIRGLSAPKGMALYKGILYVADITEVVVIDIEKSEIKKKIPVPYAERLKDITIDGKGTLYVSDTKGKRVYTIKGGVASPYLEALQNPNGVKWNHENLYIVDNSSLFKVEYDRTLTKIADKLEGGVDGIEMADEKDFIVSAWAGVIYYIKADGSKQILLDTRLDKFNSADICFDPIAKILYVPTFWKNRVIAYELK